MTVAVDTNVIAYLLDGHNRFLQRAERALSRVRASGTTLGIYAPVYAELLAMPHVPRGEIDAFLSDTGLRVD